MKAADAKSPLMPELYTIADLVKKTGITRQSVHSRIKSLERAGLTKFAKIGTQYLLTPEQAAMVALGTGRGSNSHKWWRQRREVAGSPRRRKAS